MYKNSEFYKFVDRFDTGNGMKRPLLESNYKDLLGNYDVVMGMPGIGKTSACSSQIRPCFIDLDSFEYHYEVPEHLKHLSFEQLKGHNDLVEKENWLEGYLDVIESKVKRSESPVPLVNARVDILEGLVKRGIRVLVVLPRMDDYYSAVERLLYRNEGAIPQEEIIVWYFNLYKQMSEYKGVPKMYIHIHLFPAILGSLKKLGVFGREVN